MKAKKINLSVYLLYIFSFALLNLSTCNKKDQLNGAEDYKKNTSRDFNRFYEPLIETSLISLDVSPKYKISPGNSKWKVMWDSSELHLFTSNWIGLFEYGEKTNQSWISYFAILTIKGTKEIETPDRIGIYEFRYFQDSNYVPLATVGPLYLTPDDVWIVISDDFPDLGTLIKVSWSIAGNSAKKLMYEKAKNEDLDVIICLNPVGSYKYQDCEWEEKVSELGGEINFKTPSYAGFFIMQIFLKYKTKQISFALSNIFKISSKNYKVSTDLLNTVVSSNMSGFWKADDPSKNDWIGFFPLYTGIFTKTFTPIWSQDINYKKTGKFNFAIPNKNPAGSYVFIYFRNHVPISVSEIILAEQPKLKCSERKKTLSNIKHLVLIVTENHSFDSYYGSYCQAEVNSNPKCNIGPKCCEKPPEKVSDFYPKVLDDQQNLAYDPNHSQECERCEINEGRMDRFLTGCSCSNENNFAIADAITVEYFHQLASEYAMSDRYFQSSVGASSQNDMYLARASYVFKDNAHIPIGSVGSNCWYLKHGVPSEIEIFYEPTITSLLAKCNYVLKSYSEGFNLASHNFQKNLCYPHGYDSSDVPYGYYSGVNNNPKYMGDYLEFLNDLKNKNLPDVSFIKPLGIRTGHPGVGPITQEAKFVRECVDKILNSDYYDDTLIIYVPDESGGFYDHITPPETSKIDGIPYGARTPMLAIGKFAKKNYISHINMEHSSILKFIEWNWLNGETGHLNTRDRYVNSIGDLIDPNEAGIEIPN